MDIHQGPRTRSQAPAQAPINPEETPKKAKVIDLDIEEDADDCADEGDNGEPSEGSDAQTEERDPYEDDDFENFTTSEIVTVYVGVKRKRFFLHRDIICERSPFMEKCLKKDRFDEGYKNELYLPEDNPKAFSIIVDWIYRNRLPSETDRNTDLCHMSIAYNMADKFGMEELQNTIMDTIRASFRGSELEMGRRPNYTALALTYLSGPHKSPLKRFLVEHFVYHMNKFPRWYHDLKRNDATRTEVDDLWRIPELVSYVMKKLWQFNIESWSDPAFWDKCCYHVHALTVCPIKTAAAAAEASASKSHTHTHAKRPPGSAYLSIHRLQPGIPSASNSNHGGALSGSRPALNWASAVSGPWNHGVGF